MTIVPLTISEELFAELCAARGIACRRIHSAATMTPDYEITVGSQDILVEVKQLDPTPHDEQVTRAIDEGEYTDGAISLARRIRKQIGSGYRQLKAEARDQQSCLLVVYNNSGFHNFIDHFSVMTAMFGQFGVGLGLRSNGHVAVIGHGFLGDRRVSRKTCKLLSAVGVLKDPRDNGGLRLIVYHNPFAIVPIDPHSIAAMTDEQFRHPSPHDGRFVSWEPLAISAGTPAQG